MILIKHELKQGRNSFLIWTVSIGFLLAVCVFLYPEMKSEMDDVSKIFASMGSFSKAFGMDQVNFGSLSGFYAIECGNILGIGGAFFAAICGISVLAKEEKEHTAEFLCTHPISRYRVLTEKLVAVFLQIIFMNLAVLLFSLLSIAAIGEELPLKNILLLHLSYFLLQIEITGICFGISAFIRRGSLGIGLGIASILYFLNIISNISEKADFLKFITPFSYANGSDIIATSRLETAPLITGMIYGILGILIAYLHYSKKDIN